MPCAPSGSPWRRSLRISHFSFSLFCGIFLGGFCASSGLFAPLPFAASLRQQVLASSVLRLWAVFFMVTPLLPSPFPTFFSRVSRAPGAPSNFSCVCWPPSLGLPQPAGPWLQPVPSSFWNISAVVFLSSHSPLLGAFPFHAPLPQPPCRGLLHTFFLLSQFRPRGGLPHRSVTPACQKQLRGSLSFIFLSLHSSLLGVPPSCCYLLLLCRGLLDTF